MFQLVAKWLWLHKTGIPKWLALVSGNMDQDLRIFFSEPWQTGERFEVLEAAKGLRATRFANGRGLIKEKAGDLLGAGRHWKQKRGTKKEGKRERGREGEKERKKERKKERRTIGLPWLARLGLPAA